MHPVPFFAGRPGAPNNDGESLSPITFSKKHHVHQPQAVSCCKAAAWRNFRRYFRSVHTNPPHPHWEICRALLRASWKHRRRIVVAALVLLPLALWLSHRWVQGAARGLLYTDTENIPARRVGLVLGAGKTTAGGRENLYFTYRMQAAAGLFHAGKVKRLIVSGDNHAAGYDEANDMREALQKSGVPDSCITLDYAGFRTLDSMLRCKLIFGQSEVIVISQRFHNERALFIARYHDIDALGFCAQDVPGNYGWVTNLREYAARAAAVMDLYLLRTKPKFLGEKVPL